MTRAKNSHLIIDNLDSTEFKHFGGMRMPLARCPVLIRKGAVTC